MTEPLPIAFFQVRMYDPPPISINKLYSSSGDRRFLTSAGKKYKSALRDVVARNTMQLEVPWNRVVTSVYEQGAYIELQITLCFDTIRNGSWKVGGCMTKPKKREDGTRPKPVPRSPYKKMDATNYVKLIEDAVVLGTGIDDSCHMATSVRKTESPDEQYVEVAYTVFD